MACFIKIVDMSNKFIGSHLNIWIRHRTEFRDCFGRFAPLRHPDYEGLVLYPSQSGFGNFYTGGGEEVEVRLQSQTHTIPNPMVRAAGKPTLGNILDGVVGV
jgi:hypothetical protein